MEPETAVAAVAVRAGALKEAAAVAQSYHDRAVKWAEKNRIRLHNDNTDSARIAAEILALIPEAKT